jgi:spore maturation protein CgeB
MKICLLNVNSTYSHLLTYNGIKEGFEQIKAEDSNFDFIEHNITKQDDPTIPNYKPDYVFVSSPLAAGLRVWKKYRNQKVICFDTEGLYENLAIDTIPYTDIMCTVDKLAFEYYKDFIKTHNYNCKVYHMPLGFSPTLWNHQEVSEEYKSDVCMIGVMFDRRRKVLEYLHSIKDKINLRVITAKDWISKVPNQESIQHLHRDIVSPEEMVKYYCGAKIILCVNRDFSPANKLGLQSTTPGRVFQETACKRMVMIDNTRPELFEYFEDRKEVVAFGMNESELNEKVLYYLENEFEREAIAENGYCRTMKENTWKHRLTNLLKFIQN